ncbi:class I SAM-dependent methyltransferase [Synechococcus sp. L2F]|uniref:class I SAM-dependent methyltransferase n=1 Tax=Synechococcus sp. L2F TaxID=2823739 RepID=UPI0037D99677
MTQHSTQIQAFDSIPLEADYPYQLRGSCPICGDSSGFIITESYYRNTTKCISCGSSPRHRALFLEITTALPDWQNKSIHECSPGWDIVSKRLASECSSYVASHYDKNQKPGSRVETSMPCKIYQCEDIEQQTFQDCSFDAVIMQDVFEHIFDPIKAIREIERTLKPAGFLIMTVPLVMGYSTTRCRSSLDASGNLIHHLEPEFHGNPIDSSGSLVTVDWGYDICSFIADHTFLLSSISKRTDQSMGIIGSLCEVVLGYKKPSPVSQHA